MRKLSTVVFIAFFLPLTGCTLLERSGSTAVGARAACLSMVKGGLRPIADDPQQRFLGKVDKDTAACRGGERAVAQRETPWNDWANYWATGDANSRADGAEAITKLGAHLKPNGRGIDGALLDLEYQRVELIKFNLHDNYTYQNYVEGDNGVSGRALKRWDAMRLPAEHPRYADVGAEGAQLCKGDLIRGRTLTGICNDIVNPLMGSTGTEFARNVAFNSTFPRLGKNDLARNRHADRLDLLTPDPQVVSRRLFTRAQSNPALCNEGKGLPGDDVKAHCDYTPAPFFNVMAAFWIQFMTHDWFSHLDEGRNASEQMETGCKRARTPNGVQALTPGDAAELGCRSGDAVEKSLAARTDEPAVFEHNGRKTLARAYQTSTNHNTAWWDASQLYGYNEVSRTRLKRDASDPAKLLMETRGGHNGAGEAFGYLPLFTQEDAIQPQWSGQEAAPFPDNWTLGISFFHNLFAREHNAFVTAFRARAKAAPGEDSGLRNPANPKRIIAYRDVSDDELFEAARLVVAALIAKIHTIEWTTQLLYDEPLYRGLNSNWNGLFDEYEKLSEILAKIVRKKADSTDEDVATQWYSIFASGPGIVGLGSQIEKFGKDIWSLDNPQHVNGGINHFGSPFNFPEEFVTVYRLHPLVPDLIEYREWDKDPNRITKKLSVVETFRGKATQSMTDNGIADVALSMGRQRLGALTLGNHPQFMQNLDMSHLQTPTNRVDIAALDLIRDREHGVPRFNEFRRQIGLKQLTSFDDFVDRRLPDGSAAKAAQEALVEDLRDVYGQHACDSSKVITDAQLDSAGFPINDCLGQPDGSLVDNIEDLDTVVGWLAESTRPHGYAISETQFHIFILNASRRLFSDRFYTSSFRPEFYTSLGIDWVMNNGPDGEVWEKGEPNGHRQQVLPMKRVLMRNVPELRAELENVINTFDPWARDRGEYYSVEWKPRPGAEDDDAFKNL